MLSASFPKMGYNLPASVVFAASAAFAALNIFCAGLNDDTNVLLHGAVHLLSAHELYEHWIDVSPPLIMLIYSVPAACVLWLNLSPSVALHGFVTLLSLASLFAVNHALKEHKQERHIRVIWLSASAFVLFIAPQCYQAFADREHLFFIFALPWIVQMLLRLPPLACTAALTAAGFCIKPYNLALFAALTLFAGPQKWSWRQRIFSASSKITVSVAILYFVLICAFFPEYIQTVAPVALITYPYIQETLRDKISNGMELAVPAILLILFFIQGARNKISWIWLVLGAYAVYMLNGGWFYTRYLLQVPLLLACFALFYAGSRKWQKFAGMAAAFYFLASTVYYSALSLENDMRFTRETGFAGNHNHMPLELYAALDKAAGRNFALLSGTLWASNIERMNGYPHSVFAYDYLWPLPWLYHNQDSPEAPMVRQALFNALDRALAQKPVLIVDMSPYNRGLPKNTDILAFFAQDKDIAGKLASYRLADTIDKCSEKLQVNCRFAIYQPL